MKEVERFSLGGYAFTLEEDAATLKPGLDLVGKI